MTTEEEEAEEDDEVLPPLAASSPALGIGLLVPEPVHEQEAELNKELALVVTDEQEEEAALGAEDLEEPPERKALRSVGGEGVEEVEDEPVGVGIGLPSRTSSNTLAAASMGEMDRASFPAPEPAPEREAELNEELALNATAEQVEEAALEEEDPVEVQAELVQVLDEIV